MLPPKKIIIKCYRKRRKVEKEKNLKEKECFEENKGRPLVPFCLQAVCYRLEAQQTNKQRNGNIGYK